MDALTTPLPKGWKKVRLGDILELLTDYHANGSYEILKNNVTLLKNVDFAIMIRTTNFENNDFKNDLIYIDKKAYEFLSKSKVFAGDILVNKIANAGTAYFMPKLNQPVSLGMNLFLLRIKPSYNNLFIFKQIANYERVLKTFANGSATKTITKNVIKNLLIPLPPLNEQIAIANILSDVDRYLYSLDALILKKESVKKALSFELLSQRKRLKGFNQAWQKVRLGDILSYEQPTKFLVATTQYLQKGFTPILTAGKTFILGYTNDKHGIYTNIPVIIFDDFTTDSKMVNFPFKVKSSAIKILSLRDNNQADLKYIYEKLTLLKHQVTDHKRYWIDEFSNIEILLPPLNEQIAIANILSGLDSEIISLKNKKRQFENIKKALNHDLMSTKIRVLNK
ncbi:restriction endonuclease subunit S [Helicobacter pylori]|uniref:restriction endonuclease subunit S n=3 Tax=Helicobacter pylori TaxID=210 RepID=UPI001AE727BD|nr:restriction endonuclease subunit S [Helicobacter pylori]QTO98227.1 restriction endonuclease subunit S [Helicobacter pylori]QTP01132.1 restriction endonuclease subunit S [Helicobacter pylori]